MLKAMARIAPPQPNGKQQNLARPLLDSFGVDLRFETARSSSAFDFFAQLFQKPGIAPPVITTQSPDPIILRSA